MNGIVVLSLESGLLIYASNRLSSFGFIENGPVDAMQLSSTLFALYKAASESDDDSDTVKIAAAAIAAKVDPPPNKSLIVNDPSIAWVEQGSTVWSFYDVSFWDPSEKYYIHVLFVGSFHTSVPVGVINTIMLTITEIYSAASGPRKACPKLNICPAIQSAMSQMLSDHINQADQHEDTSVKAVQRSVYICLTSEWPRLRRHAELWTGSAHLQSLNKGGCTEKDSLDYGLPDNKHEKSTCFLPPIPNVESNLVDGMMVVATTSRQRKSEKIAENVDTYNPEAMKSIPPVHNAVRLKSRPVEPPNDVSKRTPRWRRLFNFGKKKAKSDNNLHGGLGKSIFSTTLTNGLTERRNAEATQALNSYQSYEQFASLPHRGIGFTQYKDTKKEDTLPNLESLYRVFPLNANEYTVAARTGQNNLFLNVLQHLLIEFPQLSVSDRDIAPMDITFSYHATNVEHDMKTEALRRQDDSISNEISNQKEMPEKVIRIHFMSGNQSTYIYVEVEEVGTEMNNTDNTTSSGVGESDFRVPPPAGWERLATNLLLGGCGGKL